MSDREKTGLISRNKVAFRNLPLDLESTRAARIVAGVALVGLSVWGVVQGATHGDHSTAKGRGNFAAMWITLLATAFLLSIAVTLYFVDAGTKMGVALLAALLLAVGAVGFNTVMVFVNGENKC
jgi:hypothetical protein